MPPSFLPRAYLSILPYRNLYYRTAKSSGGGQYMLTKLINAAQLDCRENETIEWIEEKRCKNSVALQYEVLPFFICRSLLIFMVGFRD